MRKISDIKAIPFEGGVVTSIPRQLVKTGRFSTFQNLRWRHPSFETRLGYIEQHTTTSNANATISMYQFRKLSAETHFFSQYGNGQVQEATNMPPTTTSGNFGSEVLATISGAQPASWSNMNDRCIFSDHVRQHQIYMGSSSPVLMFNVYKGTGVVARIPTEGNDYTIEVSDDDTSTVAILNSLNTLGNFHSIFICTPIKAKSFTFTMSNVNTNTATMALSYWNSNWTSLSITDGTSSGGATLGQSGTISWTPSGDEIPHYMFGLSGFWYRISVSAQLDATVSVNKVRFNANWQPMVNVWDGVLVDAIEAQIFDASTGNYKIFGSNSIDLKGMGTSDYCYFSTQEPIDGFYMDVGATPNIVLAVFTGSLDVTFVDGGTGDDSIKCPQNKFLSSGFEPGMTITISGTTSNNVTTKIMNVSSNTITVPTGVLTAESNKSATITFSVTPTALNEVATWTGSGFTAVTSLEDGTSGAIKSGFVSWSRISVTPVKLQFNSSGYYAHWYRIKFDKELSTKVNVGIQVMPYFNINDLGNGVCNASWKGRSLLSFTKYPHYVYLTTVDEPMFLNGNDFGLIEVGDGRTNQVLCIKPFYNEAIVWQEEKGKEGGCTTLIEGYSPSGAGSFGRLILSNRVGIMNSKCAIVIEGVTTEASGLNKNTTIAFWLSRYGVMACEGTTMWNISNDISNYFDTTQSECIRAGYENQHWIEYDSTYDIIRIGLVSGSSATEPNIFPIYDVKSKSWGFDVLGHTITSMTEVEAGSGNIHTLQMMGRNNGMVYIGNNGTNDAGVDITATAVMEIDGGGNRIRLMDEMLRVKSQTTGNVTRTIDINCINTFGEDSNTLALQAVNTGEQYRKHRWSQPVLGDHISLKWSSTDSLILYDMGVEIHELKNAI